MKTTDYPDLLRARGYSTGNATKTDYNIGPREDGACWDYHGKVPREELPKRRPFLQVLHATAHTKAVPREVGR